MALYTVTWTPEAEQQLADAWLRADDPNAIARATHLCESMLSRRPLESGTVHLEGVHAIRVSPLKVMYIVKESERLVTVVGVDM